MKLDLYLKYLLENEGVNYIYHYTSKKNIPFIKKYGLLSLYGLFKKFPKLYENNIENYIDRIKKFSKKEDINFTDVESFFKSKGYSSKSIFFSFWEIIPGLNKDRDKFVKNSTKIMIDIKDLKNNWEYTLISGSKTSKIDKNVVLSYSKINSKKFQMIPGGKFYFSHIPHLAITSPDGVIHKNLLLME